MKFLRTLSVLVVIILAIVVLPPVRRASAAPACSVAYITRNDWGTGATVGIVITNIGADPYTSWTLAWTFPGNQVITSLWNGAFTQTGASASVTNLGYNGTIPANGGTTNLGFNLNYSGTNAAPASFSVNGVACGPSGATVTSTRTFTRTPTRSNTPTGATSTFTRTSTRSRTPTRTFTATGPTRTSTRTPTRTSTPTNTPSRTPTRTFTATGPTPPPGTNTGNATWFTALGSPYGGCGLPQSALDSQYFVALNVQNSPGDYSTFHPRPIPPEFAGVIGLFDNGRNCGRWVRVTISDNCNGINDGAANLPFCRGGLGWVNDEYNGATLDMIVADSCYDSNAWCRDDPYHLDLAQGSLNQFVLNGPSVGDMYPAHWNNRHVQWQFIPAPNYSGDIKIGFLQNAQIWWTPVAISNLQNGIHGVDYFSNGAWVRALMNGDMGQSYLIGPTMTAGATYQIRVYDVNDQLINGGRIYNFSFPASCSTNCSPAYTPITYTISN